MAASESMARSWPESSMSANLRLGVVKLRQPRGMMGISSHSHVRPSLRVRRLLVGKPRSLLVAVPGVALLLLGCKASIQGEARAGSQGADGEVDAFADFDEQSVEDEHGGVGEFAVAPEAGTDAPALLGARHDVFVVADPVENCTCMAVVVGPANDPRLGWESKVPTIDPSTQRVVAFRMAGCHDAPAGSRGAAYRGYRQSGDDIIVMVEEAHPGRPQIFGAIVPAPKQNGSLLLESVPATLPYAKPLTGSATRCRVTP